MLSAFHLEGEERPRWMACGQDGSSFQNKNTINMISVRYMPQLVGIVCVSLGSSWTWWTHPKVNTRIVRCVRKPHSLHVNPALITTTSLRTNNVDRTHSHIQFHFQSITRLQFWSSQTVEKMIYSDSCMLLNQVGKMVKTFRVIVLTDSLRHFCVLPALIRTTFSPENKVRSELKKAGGTETTKTTKRRMSLLF